MKIVVSVLLVLLLCAGWITALPKPVAVDVSRELQIAQEQMDLGAYGSALNYFKQAAKKDGSLEVRMRLYHAYLEAGQRKEGKEYLKQVLETVKPAMQEDPTLVSLYGELCRLYDENGEWADYLQLAREACLVDRQYFDEYLSERYFELKYSVLPATKGFDDASSLLRDRTVVRTASGKYYMDSSLRLVLGPYADATPPLSDILGVQDENGWRFVNSNGDLYMASETVYDRTFGASGSYALACRDGQYYYLNDYCKEVLGPYDEACPFANGVAAVREGGRWHLIDSNGNQAGDSFFLDVLLDEYGTCSLGKRVFGRTEQGWQVFDLSGKPMGSQAYEDARAFAGGAFAAVRTADGWAFANGNGEICCGDLRFEDARSAGENNLAAVKINGLWGFILGGEWVGEERIASWRMVIEPAYEDAGVFGTAGIAPVKQNGIWFYIRLMATD